MANQAVSNIVGVITFVEPSKSCGNPECSGASKQLLSCSRCKVAQYCGKTCQAAEWRRHKPNCQRLNSIVQDPKCKKLFNYDMEYKKSFPKDRENFNRLTYQRKYLHNDLVATSSKEALIYDLSKEISLQSERRWANSQIGDDAFAAFLNNEPRFGDLVPFDEDRFHYGDITFSSMKNLPVEEVMMEKGATIVSVGFVNLQQLIMTELKEGGDAASSLKFVGVDMSPVVVAKNLVVYEMMKADCRERSILQVMFSTKWNETTWVEFRSCCETAMKESREANVVYILNYWLRSERPFNVWREADRLFLLGSSKLAPISLMSHEADRIGYARYLATGAIFLEESQQAKFTNVTMKDVPENVPAKVEHLNRIQQESYFYTVLPNSKLDYSKGLFKGHEIAMTNNVRRLKEYVQNGEIVCEFHCKEIDAKDVSTLEWIKSLKPDVVDWSNCLDYLLPEDFAFLVKLCNAENTYHLATFMNWSQKIYGACFIDYGSQVADLLPHLETHQTEYAQHAAANAYLLPPKQAPLLMDTMNPLNRVLGKKFYDKYLGHYLPESQYRIHRVKYSDFNIFSRSSDTIFVAFSILSDRKQITYNKKTNV